MSRRFYIESDIPGQPGAPITMDGPEAHHLIHVMRARTGEEVVLFDGSGREVIAKLVDIGRKQIGMEIVEAREADRELSIDLTLATALPKGDRQRVMIEKLVELGVATFVPLISQRAVAQPKENAISRLKRVVIEASKQCGRNRLMQISPPRKLRDYLNDETIQGEKLIAVPGGETIGAKFDKTVQRFTCVIGPEGGFSGDEVAQAVEGGWRSVSLGNSILRAETAAIAIAAFLAINSYGDCNH